MILALPARAKLNLELRVVGTRPDGYHDIVSILQAIDLHDLLELEVAPETTLSVAGLAAPAGPENLVLRALGELEAAAGRRLPVRIRLLKRIPSGAGLGGGSSDAAAMLAGVARLYGLEADLSTLARRLGSDVPFFLGGGRARALGRGDLLTAVPSEESWFVVAWPGFEVSTAAVYRAWVPGGGAVNELQPAAVAVEPRLGAFAQSLGHRWRMTGSGSAFFLPCSGEEEARREAARLDCWSTPARAVRALSG